MAQEVAIGPHEGLRDQAVSLLQSLIRTETSNPPGNEGRVQEPLAQTLTEAGFECELAACVPERPNLVARLSGERPGPVLAVLGHVDTVPANPDDWRGDPWSGDVVDGEVWGRGALDMKGQVAAEVTGCAALARDGWRPPRGDLLVILTADEERGGGYGARWLCEERPELVRADLVVNEGAGVAIEVNGERFYTVSVGEKGVFRFRLRTRGRAGHASLPGIGENALLKMAPVLQRLRERPEPEATQEATEFLSGVLGEQVGEDPASLAAALGKLREMQPAVAAFLAEPMVTVTAVPTMARASEKENVIPASCEVLVDCRVPPLIGADVVREKVADLLGAGDWEMEFAETVVGNRSPSDTPLAEAIREWLAEADPGARLIPLVMAGFSDSHWFRRAFGATVYGFCPHSAKTLAEIAPLIHGADERVSVADLVLATRFFFQLPQRVLS